MVNLEAIESALQKAPDHPQLWGDLLFAIIVDACVLIAAFMFVLYLVGTVLRNAVMTSMLMHAPVPNGIATSSCTGSHHVDSLTGLRHLLYSNKLSKNELACFPPCLPTCYGTKLIVLACLLCVTAPVLY